MSIYYPPSKWYDKDGPLIYLAGSTPAIDDGTSKWQEKAIEHLLAAKPELDICDPRPNKLDMNDDEKHIQAEWEVSHIRLASALGGIVFWFSAADKTSHRDVFQFAEYYTHYKHLKKQNRDLKLAIGFEDGFNREYFVHRIFNDTPEVIMATTLKETCELLIKALEKN